MNPVEIDIAIPPATPAWSAARQCLTRLQRAGFTSWFVGGAVRDLLMQRPVHDVDCCTAASPDEVQALFPEAIGVGRAFGVMVVPHADGIQTEIASFRSDEAYIDGRRPTGVRPASEAEDVQRRDFTINALLLDPERGLVRDHVGGLADIDGKRLRCIGRAEDRLREDRLRILRAWRFAAHYDLEIEAETRSALLGLDLAGVSKERLLQEWCRGLTHEAGWRWWSLVSQSPHRQELAPAGSPVTAAMWRAAVQVDAVLGSLLCLRELESTVFTAFVQALPWSRKDRQRLLALHQALGAEEGASVQRLRTMHGPWAEDLAELHRCLAAAGHDSSKDWLETWAVESQREVPSLCDGTELIAMGVAPGADIGRLLAMIRDAQLLGQLDRAEQVPAFVAAQLKNKKR